MKLELAVLIGLVAASPAAAEMCWVDKVYAWEDGVAVQFDAGAPSWIDITKADRSFQHWDGSGQVYIRRDDLNQWPLPEGPKYAALPLNIGDRASLGNSPHDSCTMEVVRQDGEIGIKSSSYFFLHGIDMQAQQGEEFVPAETPPDGFQLIP